MATQKDLLAKAHAALPRWRAVCSWLAVVISLAGCTTKGEEQQAGIEWSSGLNLGGEPPANLQEWRRALSTPWMINGETISFGVGNGRNEATVHSCEGAFAAADQQMRVQGPDQGLLEGWTAKCFAIRTMLDGIDPERSFVKSLTLTEESVGALPVEMALVLSMDDAHRVAATKAAGGTLGDYLRNMSIQSLEDGEAAAVRNTKTGDTQFLSILARGDLDRDGVGDSLIYSANTLRGGAKATRTADLYLVSRLEPNGPLVLRRQIM